MYTVPIAGRDVLSLRWQTWSYTPDVCEPERCEKLYFRSLWYHTHIGYAGHVTPNT